MDVTGILKLKHDVQQVSDKFKKREFVLTIDQNTQYPQYISFQLIQDKTSLIDNYQVGEEIKVSFNLKGREWTSPQGEVKYFTTIDAWRIERTQATTNKTETTSQPKNAEEKSAASPIVTDFSSSSAEGDLPF
jgi:hypothetical protein